MATTISELDRGFVGATGCFDAIDLWSTLYANAYVGITIWGGIDVFWG